LGYNTLKSEVKYGDESSRIDILLQADDQQNCYIEVKSVTLAEKNTVTSRCGYRARSEAPAGADERGGSGRSGGDFVRRAALGDRPFLTRASY
jgi:hypothetical protein